MRPQQTVTSPIAANLNPKEIAMGNMSYCRFRNTNQALDDCLTALDPSENEREISEEEEQAGVEMFRRFLEYCIETEIIRDYDVTRVSGVFEEHRTEVKSNL